MTSRVRAQERRERLAAWMAARLDRERALTALHIATQCRIYPDVPKRQGLVTLDLKALERQGRVARSEGRSPRWWPT